MKADSADTLGFWSATGVATSAILFFVLSLIVMIAKVSAPWDTIAICGSSLIIPMAFLPMMVAVHYTAAEDRRLWSHLGLTVSVLYAAMVMIVYVTQLFVIVPHGLHGEAAKVALLDFSPGSFLQMIDGLGYTLQCVALFCLIPVFTGRGVERWVRGFCIANGLAAIPVFLSYFLYSIALGIWWEITVPGAAIALAIYYRRRLKAVKPSKTA